MVQNGFCDRHGPFDPPHVSCPYCSIERDRNTGITSNAGFTRYDDEEPTNLPNRGGGKQNYNDDAPTGIGANQHRTNPNPFLDDPTQLPKRQPKGPFDEGVTYVEPEASGPLGFLIIKEPSIRYGHVHKIRDNDIIGRENSHVMIDDKKVSRQHGRFRIEPSEENGKQTFFYYDFGGANGSFINGTRVRGAMELRQDDELRLGNTVMVFKTLW